MSAEILVNVNAEETRIAFLSDNILQEIYIERKNNQSLVGNIYKGKVSRIVRGMQSAFIDIGLDRSAFLHVVDILGYQKDVDIADVLYEGQELLVQVYKDSIGGKGPRLTTQFTFPARYLVLTPGMPHVTVSQKILDDLERHRLLSLIKTLDKNGYIFRTKAVGVTEEAILSDKKYLDDLWQAIAERSRQAEIGDLIYREMPTLFRLLRDSLEDIQKIRIDDEKAASDFRDFANRTFPEVAARIEYYPENHPILDLYSVEEELQKALQRKVNLKSGGHLIIDQREAMTTIDVNTGSFLGRDNFHQTVFKTNLEAVDAIARQVRLRNLGGIIIIDFIDMSDEKNRETLLQTLQKALEKDPVKTHVSELSSLGLVQMTRKRTRESLERTLCEPCVSCAARGSLKSPDTMCFEILRDIKRSAVLFEWEGFLIMVSPQIFQAFSEKYSTLLTELEVQLRRPIRLQMENTFMQEQYQILPGEKSA